MTPLTQPAPHTTTPAPRRARRSVHATTREARKQRSFHGVLASYIRELTTSSDSSRARR